MNLISVVCFTTIALLSNLSVCVCVCDQVSWIWSCVDYCGNVSLSPSRSTVNCKMISFVAVFLGRRLRCPPPSPLTSVCLHTVCVSAHSSHGTLSRSECHEPQQRAVRKIHTWNPSRAGDHTGFAPRRSHSKAWAPCLSLNRRACGLELVELPDEACGACKSCEVLFTGALKVPKSCASSVTLPCFLA